jgi:phage-related minor tail protein
MAAGLGVEAGTLSVAIGPKLVEGFGSKIAEVLDKEVGPAADKAGKNLGEKLSKSFDKAGKAITKNLTAPLLALGGAVVTAGLELDGAFDAIQVGTGATGAALAGLQADFEAVATKSSASFDTVAGTLTDLNTRLGLAGQPLQDLTQQIVNLGEITGQAVDTEAVTKLFSAFQVPAEQYGATLDRVFQISQATGVEFGALVQQAGAQATQFQQFGFTVEESVSLLGQLEKSGIDATAMLGGLRKAVAKGLKGDKEAEKASADLEKALGKREQATRDLEVAEQKLREVEADPKAKQSALLAAQNAVAQYRGEIDSATTDIDRLNKVIDTSSKAAGVSTQQVFADTVTQIKGLLDAGDELGAQQLALEVAGPRAYANLVRAIKEGTLTAEGLTAAVGDNALSINEQFAATADFPEQLKIFKNAISVELGKIGVEVFPVITDLFNQLLPVLKDLLVEGGKVAKDLIPEISKAIKFAIPLVKSLVEFFVDLPGPVKELAVKAVVLTAAFGPVISKTSTLLGAVGKLGPAFSKLGPLIAKAFTVIMANPAVLGFVAAAAAIAAIVYVIYKNWDSIVAFFKKVWEGIKAGADALWEGIKAVFSAIGAFFVAIWDGIKAGADALWEGIKDGARAFVDGAKAVIGALVDGVRVIFETIKTLIVGYVTVAFVLPFRVFVASVKAVWAGLVAIVKFVFEAVKNLITGYINIWSSVMRNVLSVLGKIWDGLVSAVRAVFGRIRDAIAAYIGIWANAFGAVVGAVGKIWEGIKNGAKAAVDFILGVFGKVKDFLANLFNPANIAKGIGGALKGVASSIPVIGGMFKAAGGPVGAGNQYIVGERGPELFVPRTSGTIIPNNLLGAVAGAGGPQYNITVVNPVAEPASTSIPNALRRANYLRTS